jgi:hypothetical protein
VTHVSIHGSFRYDLAMLRGQDVLVLLWLARNPGPMPSLRGTANELGLGLATVQRAVGRLESVGLYDSRRKRVVDAQAEQFLLYAVRYVVPAIRGGETRGVPTSWAVPPLSEELATTGELPPVWPDPHGSVRGLTLEPLHPAGVRLAVADPEFHELLALVDALRGPADVRTTTLARELLTERLRRPVGA